MKTVGIRELKDHLSAYLRAVRQGETLLVTDRGEVIAEFAQPGASAGSAHTPAALLAMAKRGLVTLGSAGGDGLYPALPRRQRKRRSATQLLDEERGPR